MLARRILRLFSRPFDIGDSLQQVSLSNGIALAPTDGVTMDDVMRKADTALYRSKTKGCGRFSFYNNTDGEPSV